MSPSNPPSNPQLQTFDSSSLLQKLGTFLSRYQGLVGLVVLIMLASLPIGYEHEGVRITLYNRYFRSWDNFANIFRQTSITGVLAVGMTFVIMTGGIELSVGSGLALLSCVAAMLARQESISLMLVTISILSLGATIGGLNGLIVAKGRYQPFIATLAAMVTLRGLAFRVTGSNIITSPNLEQRFQVFNTNISVPVPPILWKILGTDRIWNPIPVFALFFISSVVIGHILLTRTTFGRYLTSIGGNQEATRLSGVAVDRTRILVYALNGLLVGLAALMFTARTNSGDPGSGIGYELDAIAAAVVGGTALSGGRGSLIGTLSGAMFIGVLNNVLQLNSIDRYTALALEGPILLLTVALQRRK